MTAKVQHADGDEISDAIRTIETEERILYGRRATDTDDGGVLTPGGAKQVRSKVLDIIGGLLVAGIIALTGYVIGMGGRLTLAEGRIDLLEVHGSSAFMEHIREDATFRATFARYEERQNQLVTDMGEVKADMKRLLSKHGEK